MNTYTDQQRQQALDLYLQHGTAETARRLNIPKRTVRHWANQAQLAAARGENLEAAHRQLALQHEEMRQELRSRLLEQAIDALDHMNAPHVDYRGKDVTKIVFAEAPADAWKAYAVTAEILIDKYRLEVGEATERVDNVRVVETPERLAMVLSVLSDIDALPDASTD